MKLLWFGVMQHSRLLKWAGGKRWLIEHIEPLFSAHLSSRLVEPFCGGLSVVLGCNPEQALLNDTNPHLINFYRKIQHGLSVDVSPPFANERAYYYEARARFNELIRTNQHKTEEAAQWFYYLNRTGYNGLCRFNQKGEFNVPFGRYKTINYREDFNDYREIFQKWKFTCGDFELLTDQITNTDWLYADPPYDVTFTSYSAGGFSWADQERLAHWLTKLPCAVIVSNQATERILRLYEGLGFDIKTLQAPRRIACTGDRTPALEMLATLRL